MTKEDDQSILDEYRIRARNRPVPAQIPAEKLDTSALPETCRKEVSNSNEIMGNDKYKNPSIYGLPLEKPLPYLTLPYPSSSKYILEYLYGNCKATSIYVPVEMWTQFKAKCVLIGKNLSIVISHLIADWLGGKLRIKELETEKLDTSEPRKVSNSKLMKVSNSLTYPASCPTMARSQDLKECRKCPNNWPRVGCIYPEKAEKKEKAYLRNHPMEAILKRSEECWGLKEN